MSKVALVTGANKGIGFAAAHELSKQGFHVLVGARDTERGEEAAEKIKADGFDADFITLDVTDPDSVRAAALEIGENFGGLDVLVNNAAINEGEDDVRELSVESLEAVLETNVYGPLLVTQAFWPLLEHGEEARVINVSSGAGQLHDMKHNQPAYALSKTALNALTRQFAGLGAGANGHQISVNAVCPGWVKTDMGGEDATRTPEEGAAIIVKLATMENPPNGRFLNDAGDMNW